MTSRIPPHQRPHPLDDELPEPTSPAKQLTWEEVQQKAIDEALAASHLEIPSLSLRGDDEGTGEG